MLRTKPIFPSISNLVFHFCKDYKKFEADKFYEEMKTL